MMNRKFVCFNLILSIILFTFVMTFLEACCNDNNNDNETVNVWLTTGDANNKLKYQDNINFSNGTGSNLLQIEIDANTKYQQMDGFGATLTDSAAWLIYDKLTEEQRNILIRKLFSSDDGIQISYLRLPMGASDFINGEVAYTYDDMLCDEEPDWNLEQFSIDHDKEYIIPVLKEAMITNPQLKIMASPWTAPAWMKDPCSLYGGQLKEEQGYTELYSDYFKRLIQAYKEEGISVQAVTLQNEPLKEDISLPSMRMDWWDQVNLVVYDLIEKFEYAGIDTEIILYDHNWANPDYALEVLNDLQINHNEQYQAISGTAFHCYEGTPDAQALVHNSHPQKGIYLTECTGWYLYSQGQGPDDNFEDDLVWEVQKLIIGAVRNWSKTVILWNLALDQNGGPHLPSACGENEGKRCRGLVTIHTGNNQISYHVEYYVIGHASKVVNPGAYRIASDTYDGTIETVAFKNPDGSKVLIVLNPSAEPSDFKVLWNNQHFNYNLDKKSVVTFKWK